MNNVSRALASIVVVAAAGLGSEAHAEMFTFDCISNNNSQNCQTGALQLGVEVIAGPAGQAQFIFRNTGASAASITDIYFDNGTLLGIASITNGPGVDFSQGANPGNLPGGNSMNPPFQATAGFTADSDSPAQPNGVNPGETVSIFFTLQSGGSFADVIRELYSREIRVGVHVQGFGNGGSESFVNALTPVPVPAAAWLLLSGLGLLRVARHRKTA